MIVCFKCSNETKRLLDELVDSGQYGDLSAAIAGAVSNLSLLQGALGPGDALVFPTATGVPASQKSPRKLSDSTADLFSLEGISLRSPYKLISIERQPITPVTIDGWVFGQFSKLLPAKASCRELARRLSHAGAALPLDVTAPAIAALAVRLGARLAETDRLEQRSRDEALTVGFPSNGDNADKSRLRFANQFVGSLSKSGRSSGLLVELKLARIGGQDGPRIELTEHGWKFATMPNPAIDQVAPGRTRFSSDEVTFLLNHILMHVPHEAFALHVVLNAIANGSKTPEDLDRVCSQHTPADGSKELSRAFITTQRTGVISRAGELGLISRQRDGIRVEYQVTEAGRNFIRESKPGPQ